MNKYRHLNLRYAFASAMYMLLVVATAGYSYNYLSQSGFSDSAAGTLITVVSVCGLLGQTYGGQLVDKSKTIDEKKFISFSMAVTVIGTIILSFLPPGNGFIVPLVIISFTCASVGMPMLNSMAFIYERDGHKINYGVGRGIGSAAYAVGSSLLGTLWGRFGRNVMPYYIAVFALLTLLAVQLMPTPSRIEEAQNADEEKILRQQSLSYGQFFSRYKKLMISVAAIICLMFCHMIINLYIAKVIAEFLPEGASVESIQGTALFIQAMCELPTMFLFTKLIQKFGIHKLMIFAAVMYSVKHILILLCTNVPTFYAAMVLQMFSYAIIIPGSVYLSNDTVAPSDRNKGQAVMAACTTIGSLLASFIGGQLFTFMSVHNVIFIGVIFSVIGTLLMIIGIQALKTK